MSNFYRSQPSSFPGSDPQTPENPWGNWIGGLAAFVVIGVIVWFVASSATEQPNDGKSAVEREWEDIQAELGHTSDKPHGALEDDNDEVYSKWQREREEQRRRIREQQQKLQQAQERFEARLEQKRQAIRDAKIQEDSQALINLVQNIDSELGEQARRFGGIGHLTKMKRLAVRTSLTIAKKKLIQFVEDDRYQAASVMVDLLLVDLEDSAKELGMEEETYNLQEAKLFLVELAKQSGKVE